MPPRLITGITLLFWGGMTGHSLLGLIAALLVEARSWVNIRWKFSQKTYIRSWHYSILCGALIGILAWINGKKVGELHTLFVWVPLVLLPIELAMRYGTAEKIPLNTFSFFARKKREYDLKYGRLHLTHPRMIHTGWLYIAATLLASAMSSRNEQLHFIGLTAIVTVALIANGKKTAFRPIAWTFSLMLVFALSFAGQRGLSRLYDFYRGGNPDASPYHNISANETRTSIGRLGRLKLSPHIFWRMQVNKGAPPRLLRIATYNQYARANWKYKYKEPDNATSQRDDDGYLPSTDLPNNDIRIFQEEDSNTSQPLPAFPKTPNVRIIGEIDARILENPIPIPCFTQGIGNIGNLGKETSIECNPLGTVRLVNPDNNIIEYLVWTDKSAVNLSTDTQPNSYDLTIPPKEQAAIRRVAKSLGLLRNDLTTSQKIRRLKQFFTSEFSYTTHLTTPRLGRNSRQTAVGTFLETTRSGHCEYFATATTLLLREAGIPTRYCIGFAVSEKNNPRKEWIMRGQHAHAWCRVWITGTPQTPGTGHWEDLDLTPPSWASVENTGTNRWQHGMRQLADLWQLLREDFMLWRTQKSNQTKVMIGITLIISLLTLWIIWRLWQSRHTHTTGKSIRYRHTIHATTPLHQLEPQLKKILPPRPIGMPLTRWIQTLENTYPELQPLIQHICDLHNTSRFAPEALSPVQQEELSTACAQLKSQLGTLSKKHPNS